MMSSSDPYYGSGAGYAHYPTAPLVSDTNEMKDDRRLLSLSLSLSLSLPLSLSLSFSYM